MKTVIALLIAVSASSAFAGTVLRFEEDLGGIDIGNACLTATEIKSIRAQKVCAGPLQPVEVVDADNKYTNWVCPSYTMAQLSYPRTTQVPYCAKYGYDADNLVCVKMASKPRTVGHVIKVQVEKNSHGEAGPDISFSTVTLPSCK